METRRLGPLEVTVVGLGCNNFGRRIDEDATRAVIDAALDAGVAFFDTADVYGDGLSEEFIGRVLADGRRDRVLLATKFGGGGGGAGLGRRDRVRSALEASLGRLQTDHVDLYQHHREDAETPLEETVGVLDELVREGKIRAYGTSNYAPERVARVAELAQGPYVSEQSEYSLFVRDVEGELLGACERAGVGFIPYFPLASGLLTGKVSRDRPAPEDSRLHGRELSDEDYDRVERVRAFAEERGVTMLEVAFGYLLAHEVVGSVIAGATKPEQVRANAAAGAWRPTADDLAALQAL